MLLNISWYIQRLVKILLARKCQYNIQVWSRKIWLLYYRNIERECIDSLLLLLGFSIPNNIDVTFRSSVFSFPYHARYRFCDTSQSRTEYHYHMVNARDNHVSTSCPRLNDTLRFFRSDNTLGCFYANFSLKSSGNIYVNLIRTTRLHVYMKV